jgi:hypothetical protein
MNRYRATTTKGQTWLFVASSTDEANAAARRLLVMRCPDEGETVDTVAEDLPRTEHERGIARLAEIIQREQRDAFAQRYGETNTAGVHWSAWQVTIKPGRKYTNIDVGQSGKYMVDDAGAIFGIKAYGVIHKGHRFGTLETVAAWDWSGYRAETRAA